MLRPSNGFTAGTILVVDDDEMMRELLFLHLASAGHDVDLAEDAVVAGRKILQRTHDLLLVDVEMPYWNGLDFVATLRADPSIAPVPVIVMSAHEPHVQRARRLGLDALLKPFFKDALLDLVAHKLRHGSADDTHPTYVLPRAHSRMYAAPVRALA